MFAQCIHCGGAAHPASPHFSGSLDCLCIACSVAQLQSAALVARKVTEVVNTPLLVPITADVSFHMTYGTRSGTHAVSSAAEVLGKKRRVWN